MARGYRGDPLRTAERFVDYQGLRWYRTGDSARYHPDGTVEFLGRTDFQLKLHGYRIEAGEIETVLMAWPGIEQAVVLLAGTHLAAMVRSQHGPAAPAPFDEPGLREHLAQRLPAYMLPTQLWACAQWPLTGNGKIDRKALQAQLLVQVPSVSPDLSPPSGAVEQRVAQVWQQLLGCSEVRREHNFFSLGGDSLSATRVVRLLADQGVGGARVADLFSRPVLAQFCAALHLTQTPVAQQEIVADPAHRHAPFPMTEVQQAYWLGRDPSLVLGGVSCHFYREYDVQDLDLPRLQQALNRLIERHDMLRAVFDPQGKARILAHVPPYAIGQAYQSVQALR
ncbi:MAG: Tyrocidine synthase 1 [Pseudomonas fluorescens]|nr:MAG: Tyrocidine synthase 1 [Pseudomonas fluorescens]